MYDDLDIKWFFATIADFIQMSRIFLEQLEFHFFWGILEYGFLEICGRLGEVLHKITVRFQS